jgi:hypothetical protein
VPDDRKRDAGRMLARIRNTAAVPFLCKTVGKTAMVDADMFDSIEELATDEQLPLVDALPSSVRAEQRDRAKQVVAAVHARLGR